MKKDLNLFDTSNYLPNNVYTIPRINRKILGTMKDEMGGYLAIISRRSKMYTIKLVEEFIKKVESIKKGHHF